MAPFLEERIEYLLHWEKLGATRNTLKTIAEYELHIIKYLSMERLRVVNIDEIREASKVWAKEKNVTRRTIEYSPHGERVFSDMRKAGWDSWNVLTIKRTRSLLRKWQLNTWTI